MICSKWLVVGFLAVALQAANDPDGTTPLHWAVRANDVEAAQRLLHEGANPDAANRYGVTPLSLAAENASAPLIQALLQAGAHPTESILMTAARTGNGEVVRMLLARGANANARESSLGETALMWAAAENHPDAVRALIEHGADPNARSDKLEYPKDRFGLEGVTTILPHGSWTALMYAGRQGSLEAARTLAEMGADLNLADPDGTTALEFAILNGHFDTAAMLTEKGADPNIADSTGMAALYAAVDMNTLGEIYGRPGRKSIDKLTALDLIPILLAHSADPNATLKSATLTRAHTPGEPSLGAGTTPLMRAARNGDLAAMRVLIAHGADPSLKQKNGTTALMFAAGLGRGTGVFAKDYATEAELLAAVKFLVELGVQSGVDVNAANDAGQTALHIAAQASDGIVKYLAEHGANLDAKDKQGRTPLDAALGVGMRARIGGEPTKRESTAALLRTLMSSR
ncbi:MAG TPA: ankyrin repeat domain-containing protein [Bryobacteraceae bacterium]|jgi:ankyrin repeat protein|nr:ankyrin repeat domain-containing protein [Bryobacteraceae bacterium]